MKDFILRVEDIFDEFRNAKGGYKETIPGDIEGMLSVFEAAHLPLEGEGILTKVILLTRKYLLENGSNNNKTLIVNIFKQVGRSLKTPFHWRIQRSKAKFFIDAYRELGFSLKHMSHKRI